LISSQFPIARGISVVVLLLVTSLVTGPLAASEDTPALTQQLIVKFKAGTEGDLVALRAMRDQARQPIDFADLAASLSSEVGVSIRIVAVTSGRELVISVDVAAVTSAVVAGLTKQSDVVRATLLDANASPQVNPRDPAIEVEFADDSAIAKSLADGWLDQLKDDAEARRLTQDILRETGVEVVPRPPRAQIVTFTLDVSKLTLELADRLKKRPDVEYVEPVRLLQPLPQQQ
jgi:hypothetical protein